ncbi:unnamed protein product [Symbiodinium sp. CCMP2592]|nr:unnamed protein product [Symbiodinium sp. CCMP2592]
MRALEVVSGRLVELWTSRPQEAEMWLGRCQERFATKLAGKSTRHGFLFEALRWHCAVELGKYDRWGNCRFSDSGLCRGDLILSEPIREHCVALYLHCPHACDRCYELAKRLMDSIYPFNRLVVAEAELGACEKQREQLENRAAAAESAGAEMGRQLWHLHEEHIKCQEHSKELVARLEAEAVEHASSKVRLSQAESDVERLQEESRGFQERCQLAEVRLAEAPSQTELQVEKAVLQLQLTKAEAERSAMLGQLLELREEKGMHKERIRELERQLCEARQRQAHDAGGPSRHGVQFSQTSSSSQQADLAEQLGYSFVDDDGTASSVLSCSSWFSVKPDAVKPQCFMVDAIFKTRSYGADFFLMGRDLKKGSQVVAGDDASILEVAKTPEICDAREVVELQAGAAVLQVTPDHLVQVADPKGKAEDNLYLAAGNLKTGDLVMLDSGEVAALTSVVMRRMPCQVLKIVFEPYLPVAVFSRPACILSLGQKKKPPVRRGGKSHAGPGPSDDSMRGEVSIPITAGEYMD